MTRINCVPVENLCREHLVAEYREIPRVFALAHKHGKPHKDAPKQYTLGKGHVIFFYDKLGYISERFNQLIDEMKKRGYTTSFDGDVSLWKSKIPANMWKNWCPTENAIKINQDRIEDRKKNFIKKVI